MDESKVYFSPKLIEVLKQQLHMSPETWHKVMNPTCGMCMLERGRVFLEQRSGKKQ